jgi:uncharacterized protein involved in type VI secretion and phage assembly
MSGGRKFYGKYRGVVSENDDGGANQGQKLGRIRAKVPDVFGDKVSGWALPCVPYAGKNVGLFLIPPEGASVWIEFEHGDPEYPIWSGCFWGSGEVPLGSYTPDTKVLRTGFATVTVSDASGSGSVTVESNDDPKLKIVLDGNGIEISNGKDASVTLSGKKVSINGSALEVE